MPRTPVRPGHVVVEVLSGRANLHVHVPTFLTGANNPRRMDEDRGRVTQATATELHQEYKYRVGELANSEIEREKHSEQRGMTYQSFKDWLQKARRLGLIEIVGTTPFTALAGSEELRYLTGAGAIEGERQLFALTPLGASVAVVEMWENISAAYNALIEGGPVAPPTPKARGRKAPPAPAPAPVVPAPKTAPKARKKSVTAQREDTFESARSSIEDAASKVRGLADEIGEVRDSLEEHFSGTERYTWAEETAGKLEEIADALEELDLDIVF